MGIWISPPHNQGIVYYSNERVTKQPNLFEDLYSKDVWSIRGPEKDKYLDNINFNSADHSEDVAYTDEELKLFERYVKRRLCYVISVI